MTSRNVSTSRAAVLTYIMHWGLNRGPIEEINQGESPGPVRHFYLYVASDLYAHVQQVATTAGGRLRHGSVTWCARSP